MKQLTINDFEKYAVTHPIIGKVTGIRQIMIDSNITSDMTVLDVGCGDGKYLDYLACQLPKDNLYGTEISEIRVNRVKSKGYNCCKVDSVKLPFQNAMFDAIIFFEVIEHIPETDVSKLLEEFARVIKPNGLVIETTPNYPIKRIYDFLRNLKSRFLGLLHSPTKAQTNSIKNHDEEKIETQDKPLRTKIEWIKFQFTRLFADDPTHQFFCNFTIIHKLGAKHFKTTQLFTTFTDELRPIKSLSLSSFFSHKIGFVFTNNGDK